MNSSVQARVVIVGAGHAGGRAAIQLRQLGYLGPIVLIGDEPCLPYERPPLSKDVLKGVATAESTYLQDEVAWRANDVELHSERRVIAIDRQAKHLLLDNENTLPYDKLVLATGARPRPFPGISDAGARVHMLRTLADAAALHDSLVAGSRIGVLGAGFIGLEVASAALELGAQPIIVESASRPLARLLPAEFAEWLTQLAIRHGVKFRFHSVVERIGPDALQLSNGESINVDATVIGIGAIPNSELAAEAGLLTDDGIMVDAQCQTSDPSIYAIGDVARRTATATQISSRIESWRKAEDDALKIATVLNGDVPQSDGVPWFWTDVFGHNVQLAGEPADKFTCIVRGDPEAGPFLNYYLDAGGVPRGAIGVNCGRELRAAQKLIAAGQAVDQGMLPVPRPRRPSLAVPG